MQVRYLKVTVCIFNLIINQLCFCHGSRQSRSLKNTDPLKGIAPISESILHSCFSSACKSFASFDNWKEWSTQFPNCDPKNNHFTSPVNIDTNAAIRDKKSQALFVYAEEPTSAVYSFSMLSNLDGITMEVLNINLNVDDLYQSGSYIGGAGRLLLRHFTHAFILFSNSSTKEPKMGPGIQSGHRINGKGFPMEIVMLFTDHRKEFESQIHVLVEVSNTDHPGMFIFEEAVKQINIVAETRAIDQMLPEAVSLKKELSNARKLYEEQIEIEKNETSSIGYKATYKDLKALYEMVKTADSYHLQEEESRKLEKEIVELKDKPQKILDDRAVVQKNLDDILDKIQKQLKDQTLAPGQVNADTEKADSLKIELDQLNGAFKSAQDNYIAKQLYKVQVDSDIREKQWIFKKHKIGTGAGETFSDVEAIKTKLFDLKNKFEKFEKARNTFQEIYKEAYEILPDDPREVTVDLPFQISWLFPATGGYYAYDGSGVIPPCKRKSQVLVLETPISISHRQLHQVLAKAKKGITTAQIKANVIPEVVGNSFTTLRELGKRKVRYIKKNIQFKFDDGMHMKSSLRRSIKNSVGLPIPAYFSWYAFAIIGSLQPIV